METHLSLVSWIYIAHAHMHKILHLYRVLSDRSQLMGWDGQHSFSKALFNLSSLLCIGNIISVSPILMSPDTSVYSLSSVRYRHLSSHCLLFFLCLCVNSAMPVLTVLTLCIISVCLPSLALFLPLETSQFSDLKPLGDLADCGGGLCVSLNHLANSARTDSTEKSNGKKMWGVK